MTDTKKLVRKGECNHCGVCCGDCKHLDKESKLCKIWRNGQPEECRKFPTHPRFISQHFDCSIRFYDAETGVEVTKKKHRRPDSRWECDWNELNSYLPLNEEYP